MFVQPLAAARDDARGDEGKKGEREREREEEDYGSMHLCMTRARIEQ